MDQTVELLARCEALIEAVHALGVKTDSNLTEAIPSELGAIFDVSALALLTALESTHSEGTTQSVIEAFLRDCR